MMPLELYLAFLAATTMLILIPGPNVTLIVANSLNYGARYALTTVMGTSSAMVVQLTLTVLGMTTAMLALSQWFEWLRWIGVAYLLWLGVSHWRRPRLERDRVAVAPRKSLRRLFWQGFLVSLTNPKTLLFYAAFLPQFLDPAMAPMPQLLLLSGSFVAVAVLLDSAWCVAAGRVRPLLAAPALVRLRDRVTGTLLIASGLGLALARRS
jgi:threonine/homoserine/homoserine lactone efflux protein